MTSEAQHAAEPPTLVAMPDMAIAAPAAAAPETDLPRAGKAPRKTWREERWERRRRRLWFEEVLGWILVPVIGLALYYIVMAVLGALGTSPAAIMEGINAILANF